MSTQRTLTKPIIGATQSAAAASADAKRIGSGPARVETVTQHNTEAGKVAREPSARRASAESSQAVPTDAEAEAEALRPDTAPYEKLDDATLMSRCRQGDEAAFHALYERYRDWVLRQARRYLRQDEDAFDVMQEVFRYLFSIVPTYRPEALLTTLLYKVVRNTSLSELQRRRRGGKSTFSLDDEEARDLAVAPEDPGQDCPLETKQVTDAIDGLPEIYREVILLRLVEEWPYQQISEALDLPLGTVKSRLHYGLDILRQKLSRFVRI